MRNLSVPYWLIAALIAFFFVNLGGYLLFDHDEGAFSEATGVCSNAVILSLPTLMTGYDLINPF